MLQKGNSPAAMKAKERRTYGFLEFVAAVAGLFVRAPLYERAHLRRRLSGAFNEKLMLAVTAVNGCRYCAWAHAFLAARCEVPADEISSLLSGSIERPVSDGEARALAFAQHYAESGSRPDAEALARLRDEYGSATAGDILLTLRFITWGNLSGNTFRAFLERIAARRFRGPGFWDDLLVFLVTAPIFGPAGWLMRRDPK
jgi:AhpD family alkylhydroperoxidase